MLKNQTQETILELKKQLSEMPDEENFREKREKLEVKITSHEIMSTPAANDFLKDLLEEKKKLLPEQGIFSFAQILTREQFYRHNGLPAEINNLIEEKVWNLVWEEKEQPPRKELVFYPTKWRLLRGDGVRMWRNFILYLTFSEPIEIETSDGYVILKKTLISGIGFEVTIIPENWQEWLGMNKIEESPSWKDVKKKTKLKIDLERDKSRSPNFLTLIESQTNPFLILTKAHYPKIINLTREEQISAQQTKEILWLLRVLRKDISLGETAPAGLREQQEFLQNHFKREFEKLHADNPQLLDRVKDLPWFKFHTLYADIPKNLTKDLTIERPQLDLDEPANFPTNFELNEETKAQIRTKLTEGDEKHEEEVKIIRAQNQTVVALQTREQYQPLKICANKECQTSVRREQKYCRFCERELSEWEIQADQRLNARRDKIFPNLSRTTTPEENQNRYHTTVEDESENNEPEPNRPNSEGNHGENSNESNNQEPKNNEDGENEKSGEYNKWDTIKSWFGYGTQKVARTAERINDAILENEYVRSYVGEGQWQTFCQKADKVTTGILYVVMVLAIIFIYKLIRKFFAKLFKWADKKKKASKPEPTATKNDRKKIKKTTPPRDTKGRFIKKTKSKVKRKANQFPKKKGKKM